jgi:hypothetical protein
MHPPSWEYAQATVPRPTEDVVTTHKAPPASAAGWPGPTTFPVCSHSRAHEREREGERGKDREIVLHNRLSPLAGDA